MLPDFSETKRLFKRFFETYMRQKAREVSPLLNAVQVRYIHEGRGMKVTRADNSESESKIHQLSAMGEIKFDEIPDLTFEAVIRKFDEITIDMARQQINFAMERISDELPESQTIDAKGQRLSPEIMYRMFDAIDLEYNPDGTPQPLHLLGHLFTEEKLLSVQAEIKADPEMNRKFDELMKRKKEDWLAREAARKLVG
jgi:hypothetical protein